MTMTPFNGDQLQSLKWLQNKAPNIQSMAQQKADWYSKYCDSFWTNWQTAVFDIRTANNFGLAVWAIILGLPAGTFNFSPLVRAWAYGPNRQNYVFDPNFDPPSLPNPNTIGGNFYGSGQSVVTAISEIRYALLLRYVALVSNGRLAFVNHMLQYIFNGGEPWDFPNNKFFYVTDSTDATSPTSGAFNVEYRIGKAMNLSAQFISLISSEYGVLPSFAGSKVTVVKET